MRRHQKRQFTIPYERICVASRESSPSCARVPSIFRFRVRARERNNLVQPLVHDYSVATTHNAINGVKLRRKKANRLRCSATGEGQQLTNSNLHRFHTSFLLLRSSRFFFFCLQIARDLRPFNYVGYLCPKKPFLFSFCFSFTVVDEEHNSKCEQTKNFN